MHLELYGPFQVSNTHDKAGRLPGHPCPKDLTLGALPISLSLSLSCPCYLLFIVLQTHFVIQKVKVNLRIKQQVHVHVGFADPAPNLPPPLWGKKNFLALNSQGALPEILVGSFSLRTLFCLFLHLCLISLKRGGNCSFFNFA